MNLILGKMTGEFYMIHDADDLSHPERVERQLAALLENPTAAAAFCGHELILNGRHVAPISRYKGPDQCRREIDAFRMPAHDPTGMYRWVSVRDLRYDATLLIGEGFDYILRVGERFPMLVLGECLYSYRIHPASLTKRNPAQRELLVREVLRQACKRRNVVFEKHFGNVRERGHRSFDNNLAANFMESVCDLRDRGRYLEALKTGVFCSRLHPLDFHYQKALLYALTPRRLLSRIRRSI